MAKAKAAKAKAAKAKKVDDRPRRNNQQCERCTLHSRSATVCCESVGHSDASIFLVGEALGKHEEELGRPFVGDAGFKLNFLLSKAGLKRKSLRLGNAARCRPPANRVPNKKELTACWPYLLHDILSGKPKVIVALGATAIKMLMQGQRNVSKTRGFPEQVTFRWESSKGKVYEHTCWVMPTSHPAACLHDWRNDDLVVRDLQIAKLLAAGKQPMKWPDTKVTVIKKFPEVIRFLRHLKRIGKFVIDLETTGLDPHTSKILCVGICYKAGHATVLPLLQQGGKPFWKPHEFNAIVEEFTELLETAILYGQNLKFDIKHLRKLTGLINFRVGFDTMAAHHCVDENKPHNLTFLTQWYLGWLKYDVLMAPYHGRTDGYASVPDGLLHKYCGYDVDGTWQVRRKLIPLLKRDKLIRPFRIELGLINVLADVEYRGVRADVKKIDKLAKEYRRDVEKARSYLKRIAAKKMGEAWIKSLPDGVFNPNSPKQLAPLLLKCGANLYKKTAGGKQLSTDKNVMGALELGTGIPSTIARKMKEVRKLGKYISTYLDGSDGQGGFKQWIRSHSRIHASYNIAIARTGRLSADDPPLQTVPRLGGLRSMFLPDHSDHVFLSIDYQKVELCVMAYLANDDVMARELINRVDLHSRMAITKRLNRDPTDEEFERMLPSVTKEERALAKGVNFGIPYGISDAAIVEQYPEAFPVKMPRKQRIAVVRAIMNAYFEKYWGVAQFREQQVERAHSDGYIRTLVGRVRRLSGVEWFDSRHAAETEHLDQDVAHLDNQARNTEVQSFASDFLSMKTKEVYDGIQRAKIPTLRMVMTLHDQLLFNVHKDHQDKAIPMLVELMEGTLPKTKRYKYNMPIRVDVAVQRYWGEFEYSEEKKLWRRVRRMAA